jgi:hypothetical protein
MESTEALISQKWARLRAVQSSLARSVSTSLRSGPYSFNISDEIDEVRLKIKALEYIFFAGDPAKAPDDIREFLPTYKGADQAALISLRDSLERKETVLMGLVSVKIKGPWGGKHYLKRADYAFKVINIPEI